MEADTATEKPHLRLATRQTNLVKAAIASTEAINAVRQSNLPDKSLIVQRLLDGTAVVGRVCNMSMSRRNAIKPAFKTKCAEICSEKVPVTSQLFGDDWLLPSSKLVKPKTCPVLPTRRRKMTSVTVAAAIAAEDQIMWTVFKSVSVLEVSPPKSKIRPRKESETSTDTMNFALEIICSREKVVEF